MSPMASIALGLPTRQEIRNIALRAFLPVVKKVVAMMAQRQAVYNMSGVRGDGHFQLAKRIGERVVRANGKCHFANRSLQF